MVDRMASREISVIQALINIYHLLVPIEYNSYKYQKLQK
jgi:hypothetical protein